MSLADTLFGRIPGFIYHRWIEDRPEGTPPALVGAPRVDEGAPVPLIYGRCRVRAPILAWVGAQRSVLVSDANPGFVYFVDMFYVLGIPFYGGGATLLSVYAGDQLLTLTTDTVLPSNAPSIIHIPYRGHPQTGMSSFVVHNTPAKTAIVVSGENAVTFGAIEFFGGSPTQVMTDGVVDVDNDSLTDTQGAFESRPMNDAYWFLPLPGDDATRQDTPLPTDVIATRIPSYRNMCTAMMWRWCNGDRAALTNYSFEVRSMSTMFGHSLTDDADPAAVLFDVLTSTFGKLGLPESKVDATSFQTASDTLFAESHGYSRAIEHDEDATAFIGDLLRQTDGTMYEEPTTGKLVYRLVRFDYSVGDLDDINPDNSVMLHYSVQGWNETLNQVRVKFTDRVNAYAEGTVIGQNPANVAIQGGRLRSVDLSFPHCATRALAQKIASRELAAVSSPQVKASFRVNRTFYQARPADVFTLTWPDLGISGMVMRVARVNRGQLHKGQIVLDVVRDIFDVSLGAYPVTT